MSLSFFLRFLIMSLGCVSCTLNSHGSSTSTIEKQRTFSCVDEGDSDLANIVVLPTDWVESKKNTYPSFGHSNPVIKPRVFKSQLSDTEPKNKSTNPSAKKVSFKLESDCCKEPKHLPGFLYANGENNEYYTDGESDKKSSSSTEIIVKPSQDKNLKGILKKKTSAH